MLKSNRVGKESFEKKSDISSNGKTENFFGNDDFILIIGEHYETRLLLKTLLELWKYRTIESPTVGGAENLSGFFPPQLILLDTNSSFSQALENITLVRENRFLSALPLIVISGYTQPHFRDLAMKNGADVYLTKPLNFALMERMMKKLINGGRNTNGVIL